MMKNLNPKVVPIIEPVVAVTPSATVISIDTDGNIEIEVEGGRHTAKLAFSCLVQPQPDDVVMFSKLETGQSYILGVIERPGCSDMTIALPGKSTIKSNSGSLSIISAESINMMASKNINSVSDQAIHKSREAVFDYQELIAKGENLQASYSNIRVFGNLLNVMAKQVINRFKSYIRNSEESDMVKSAQMTREVSGLYSMDTKYTIMISKKDTKIDGERIHMG
jgi:hypothetical protein